MAKKCSSKQQTEMLCMHCKAPVKSVFEGPPLQTKLEEKNYILETDKYNIKHIYDQEKKELPKEWKPKSVSKEMLKSMSIVSRVSENPLTQNWSGYTFMTEHEDERIERAYQENKLDSNVDRVVWRTFHKKLKQQKHNEMATNAGPEWFQDMSPQQMELVDNLEAALKSDLKESHSGRSQQFLYDLGIWPEVPPKLVAKAVKQSGGNVISFLFQVHQELVTIETPEYEKKFADAKIDGLEVPCSGCLIKRQLYFNSCSSFLVQSVLSFSSLLDVSCTVIWDDDFPHFIFLQQDNPPETKKSISPFSINERILLTSVFHYHYPTLLKKLDQLLPPPYKEPDVLWGKKPPKKKLQYPSPYLEPLPINDKPWYEERAEEELERKVLRKIKRAKERKDREELMEKMKQQETKLKQKQDAIRNSGRQSQDTRPKTDRAKPGSIALTIFEDEDLTNLTALPPRESLEAGKSERFVPESTSAQGAPSQQDDDRAASENDSMKLLFDTLSDSRIIDPQEQKPTQEGEQRQPVGEPAGAAQVDKPTQLKFASTNLLTGLFGSNREGNYLTRCLLDTEVENISEDIHLIKAPSLISPRTSSEATVEEFKQKNFWVPLDITFKELTSVTRISSISLLEKEIPHYTLRRMSGPPLPDVSVIKNVQRVSQRLSQTNESLMKKPYVVECTEPECAIVENLEVPMNEFEFAKRRISTMPPKKQLGAAIRFLSDKGDPLGVLPKMELVPWLVRWFDKRRGVKRNLTKEDKEELLLKSQNMWNTYYTSVKAAPMPEIPDKVYKWSQKKWLMDLLESRIYNHQRAIKHIMINNARDLFPSMFCEYFDTPLNKSFRKTFYAYFPARERDCLVSRPWDPSEKGSDKPSLVDK